ncbi:MAG: hypothetical protein DCC67_15385 [Planctomycetota bacterium]|nr:MAG: hypothetical protein DCC67_15385 [Planctomycetota bacterium]
MNEASASIVQERLGPSAVDDVRAIRQELDDRCGGDLRRLAEHARQSAEKFRQRQDAGQRASQQDA